MGMLEEIPGGHLMAAWQAAPDLEGGAEQSVYFAYGKDGASGREWGAPHKLPHGAADKSVAGTEDFRTSPGSPVHPPPRHVFTPPPPRLDHRFPSLLTTYVSL